jgi:exodeoxyribonuclease VII small subunit
MAEKGKQVAFEDALKKLESVVARLEAGDVPLEESIRLFEEGMALAALCQSRLDEADRKIDLLLRRPEGNRVESEDESEILGGAGRDDA